MIADIKTIKLESLKAELEQIQGKLNLLEEKAAGEVRGAIEDFEERRSIRETIREIEQKIQAIESAKTLKELGMDFEDALEMLEKEGLSISLTEEDKVITENESDFTSLEDCVFIHRTQYLPKDSTIKTSKSAGALSYYTGHKSITINGETYDIETKSARESIHFSLNGEVAGGFVGASDWDKMKYTIIIPGSKINEEQLAALGPEDSWFKGDLKLPEGAYVLVPESEREEVARKLPEATSIVGYSGDPKGYAQAFISSMGYKSEEVNAHSWENNDDAFKVRALAREKGIYTGKHFGVSAEYKQQASEEANNFIVEVFKLIRENKDSYENLHSLDISDELEGAFRRSYSYGKEDGFKDLSEKLEAEGLVSAARLKESMDSYKQTLSDEEIYEYYQEIIQPEILWSLQPSKSIDNPWGEYVEEFEEVAEDPRTMSAVQKTQQAVKSAVQDRPPEEVKKVEAEEITQ